MVGPSSFLSLFGKRIVDSRSGRWPRWDLSHRASATPCLAPAVVIIHLAGGVAERFKATA
jgi:hypothetical protein